ncbi:MAG TPA: MFS transporter, partial [Chitinophagaceae bacterium]|nr:MFS transporter [Chitinophagaceae bacterium]
MNTKSQYRGTFISLFIATAAAMLGIGIIEPIMPLYAKNMGASGIMLGLIFSGFAVSRMVFAPWIGKISDKKGRKKFLICGICLLIIFSFL